MIVLGRGGVMGIRGLIGGIGGVSRLAPSCSSVRFIVIILADKVVLGFLGIFGCLIPGFLAIIILFPPFNSRSCK